jgi:signal transduction histidine kinase
MRHSLVVRTPRSSDNRFGAAWFTLEASPDADPTRVRIPADFLDGGRGIVTLTRRDTESADSAFLFAPNGSTLGSIEIESVDPNAAAARLRSGGRAIAGGVMALALLVAAYGCRAGRLPHLVGLLVMAARTTVMPARTLETLLPRSLGGPSLYGVPGWGGLLDSPAGIGATCAVWLWFAVWIDRSRPPDSRSRGFFRPVLASVAALTSAFALAGVASSLARNGRVELFSLAAAGVSAGHAVLLGSLAAATLATAYLVRTAWTSWGGGDRARGILALAMLASAVIASEGYLSARNGLAAERLESEFAPLVVEQSARRRLALEAHVTEVARTDLAADLVARQPEAADLSAGWALWSGGPLGLRGWLSSIDVIGGDGSTRARFAFGLPPLEEPRITELDRSSPGPPVRAELISFGASEQRLLHSEAPILLGDSEVGRVVAHVLDEPDNLPFLPGVAPYLSALGSPSGPREGPEYVLYSSDGRVLLSTLPQPPALTAAWTDPDRASRVFSTSVGGNDFLALPIPGKERVHLLLADSGGWLERAGGLARIALLEGLLLGLGVSGYFLVRGLASWSRRGAFYRKILAAMLAASLLPLLGLASVLRGTIEVSAERSLRESSANIVGAVRRVVEDYAAVIRDDESTPARRVDDGILYWLRNLVGQEIHVYENDVLAATSKPELFESGLLSTRLPGEVRTALLREGEPTVVRDVSLGGSSLPVAYARADLAGTSAVVAVPLVLERREIGLAMERVLDSLLLTTVLLGALLAAASAWVARAVSRPVREMVDATARVARGDYGARLRARSRDELASLAEGFNAMATALASQRSDLERRRDYMEALLRHATLGVVSTGPSGSVVTVNPAAKVLLDGAGATLTIGQKLSDAMEAQPALRTLARIVTGPPPDRVEPEEIDLRIPGSPRRIRVVRIALPDPEGGPAGTLMLLDDVTELARSSQLAAWAEMARAIAHEIKNPLTPIQLSTEHLERILRDRGALPDADLEACLKAVLSQVRALREIASEFSAYARLPDPELEPAVLSSFLEETLAPYRAALPAGVRLEETYESDRECALDRRTMSRAVANLIENALHAMPSGGVLKVSTGFDAANREVFFTVQDTGTGLSDEARERLFEPYFSTKTSGTGLGLAIVLRTVQSHGGHVDVASVEGQGTTFRVFLPAWTSLDPRREDVILAP